MPQRALGLLILVAGGVVLAMTLGADGRPSAYLLVVGGCLVAAGFGLVFVRDRTLAVLRGGGTPSRREDLRASLKETEGAAAGSKAARSLQQAFAVAKDDDGDLRAVDRSEVEAYFEGLLVRWRGPLALAAAGFDGDFGGVSADGRDGAATELRADILRAERYLRDLLFRDATDARPYDDILADLDALLRRLGDTRWGEDAAGRTP